MSSTRHARGSRRSETRLLGLVTHCHHLRRASIRRAESRQGQAGSAPGRPEAKQPAPPQKKEIRAEDQRSSERRDQAKSEKETRGQAAGAGTRKKARRTRAGCTMIVCTHNLTELTAPIRASRESAPFPAEDATIEGLSLLHVRGLHNSRYGMHRVSNIRRI